ncbi:hypothetical protein [Herminiimonas arsenitoxidans]|uniref:hypothetical protein n=1 Tax=Herminiimonas arsenitoxidans TaxID=1809410 RepID=UPI000970A572|nr:hypothetical protein [Herminiimonas arsenitoxidans]
MQSPAINLYLYVSIKKPIANKVDEMFHRIALTSALIFLCAACNTTPPPNYKNPIAPDNAKVSFESDFELHTHFYVNTDNTPQSCGKFERAGYLLKRDSILLYDKANYEIKIEVPSNKVVGISASHYFDDPTYRSSCFPKPVFFTPEANANYIVKVNLIRTDRGGRLPLGGQCYVSVANLKTDGSYVNVKTNAKPPCKEQEIEK